MSETRRVDIFTVAGIAAVAEVVTTLLHEGLGHGGACLLVHGRPLGWGAYYFDCGEDGLPVWAVRAVAAAGSTVNLAVAALLLPVLDARLKASGRHGAGTVFLWLMVAMNAFTWAGYFFFSGAAGIGDWGPDGVLKGVSQPLVWRIPMAVIGMGLYLGLARFLATRLTTLTGSAHEATMRAISWTAYATAGVVAILVGLLNPQGLIIVLISSMASSLGGDSGLFWGLWWRDRARAGEGLDFGLPRSWMWIIAGIAATGLFAWYFGPTLKLT